MLATWIDTAAKGRGGGPIRAGMWSAAVIGTHPIQDDQRVWLEILADDLDLGRIPAYWIENKGGNSHWQVPIPPQAVGVRLHYRSVVEHESETAFGAYQDSIVRPNLPDRTESADLLGGTAEGLVGNRMMSVRIDARGSTYDIYYPTVGLHAQVRPREGDLPQSRSHFRAIVGGLAIGRRLDWFTEHATWESYQKYSGDTNLLTTDLAWRHGPIQVQITDFVAAGEGLPRNAGHEKSPGQYIKRFRITNEGAELRQAMIAVYVQAEVNGGVGDTGLSWHDQDRALLAFNRGHMHTNRKLARDSTIAFSLALDPRGEVDCEPTGPNEAILYRWIELPAGSPVTVDLLVSGAFTGWCGDMGTFEHWLRPALAWFRSPEADLDALEQETAQVWARFVEPIPDIHFPKASYAVSFRRSALAAALHADAETGAVASGLDRGLSAYCWPRDALWVGSALERVGHPEINKGVFRFLNQVRIKNHPFLYWFQKYSMDGIPEWETPAVDQSALIPWSLECYYRRTGDLDFVTSVWPMIEQAVEVCQGNSGGHPGLYMDDSMQLVSSAGMGDQIFGCFLFSNAAVVAGLRSAAALAVLLGREEVSRSWNAAADRIWYEGIDRAPSASRSESPGLIDPETGRFFSGRKLSTLRDLWTRHPDFLLDRSDKLDVGVLALAVPFGMLPASDARLRRTFQAIEQANLSSGNDRDVLARFTYERSLIHRQSPTSEAQEVSSLATLWVVRYLIQLGRETGQAAHWQRAVQMLDAILSRLCSLGLALRPGGRGAESARVVANPGGTAWRLHAMLINATLDLAGLDYDAVDRRFTLRPVLPTAWPHTGITQRFECGRLSYRLERPLGSKAYRLWIESDLKVPVQLRVEMTCPELTELGPWRALPSKEEPKFHRETSRFSWNERLPFGRSERVYTWG
ncbi:glycosyl hydrolase [Aquisphaera insulae]|uniref:glycosyl hydrolase n=1 Tax=Aquisphaera insulae TaxID=2712864 RepID=UPI0013EB3D2B|nr:glycosyl hydrolase [Aquisphaera insulae]